MALRRKAGSWLKKAAEQGHAAAQCDYATGGYSNDKEGWLRRSAVQGHADACYEMYSRAVWAVLKANPESNPESPDYVLAHEKECEECKKWKERYELAKVSKPYTAEDKVLIKWLKKLAVQGQEEAAAVLGIIYYEHDNLEEAEKWCHQAAELDSVRGQYSLGKIYEKRGEMAEAIKWFSTAAEQGKFEAQMALGRIYGDYSTRNDSLCFKWYLAAAEQGGFSAQAKVANMYVDGVGVEADEREALKWFVVRSKDDPERWGKDVESLIRMYINGKGILEDPIEACSWFVVLKTVPFRKIERDGMEFGFQGSPFYESSMLEEQIYSLAKKMTADQFDMIYSRAIQICLDASKRSCWMKEYIEEYNIR